MSQALSSIKLADGGDLNPTALLTKLKSSTLCLLDNHYSDGWLIHR